MPRRLLVTCEHGGNRVPAGYAELFRRRPQVLKTHRAYDRGALELARQFARCFEAELIYSMVTRLLVELNRSPTHPRLFSEFSRPLDAAGRWAVLNRYYYPYRSRVENRIAQAVDQGEAVVHLSVHTFTSRLNGEVRRADVGLLYDPSREPEKRLASRWRSRLLVRRQELTIRRNYPYLGKADGLTTYLRRRFRARDYIGLELEVNQSWVSKPSAAWNQLAADLVDSLAGVI